MQAQTQTQHIIDGQSNFDMSLRDFWRTKWIQIARRSGISVPDEKNTSDQNPAIAHISHSRLLADCPNCLGAEYVWRKGPHIMVCALCGNSDIGGKCRIVIVPEATLLNKIEKVLLERPNPANRTWFINESLEQLQAENLERMR